MAHLVIALTALAALLGGVAGWQLRGIRVRPAVTSLLAQIDEQQASLTAIPAREIEHRREVADDHRRHLAERVARIDAYYLPHRRAAA